MSSKTRPADFFSSLTARYRNLETTWPSWICSDLAVRISNLDISVQSSWSKQILGAISTSGQLTNWGCWVLVRHFLLVVFLFPQVFISALQFISFLKLFISFLKLFLSLLVGQDVRSLSSALLDMLFSFPAVYVLELSSLIFLQLMLFRALLMLHLMRVVAFQVGFQIGLLCEPLSTFWTGEPVLVLVREMDHLEDNKSLG